MLRANCGIYNYTQTVICLLFFLQVKPTLSVLYEIDSPIVKLTCQLGNTSTPAVFYDELGGSEIDSAVLLPDKSYAVIFTPENETRVTCTVGSSARSDYVSILGKCSFCTAKLACLTRTRLRAWA